MDVEDTLSATVHSATRWLTSSLTAQVNPMTPLYGLPDCNGRAELHNTVLLACTVKMDSKASANRAEDQASTTENGVGLSKVRNDRG